MQRDIYSGAIALFLIAGSAAAQSGYEIGEQGLITVPLGSEHTHPAMGFVARGGMAPFATTPDQTVELRRQIGGLQIADIDQDGNNDLVAVCYISNSFPPYEDWHDMIFFGNGAGINTTPGWISDVETHTGDVQIGDLNGDGWMDIVSIHGGLRRDSVRGYFGASSGMPTAPSYTSDTIDTNWGTSGLLVDMDQDGDLDLVTTNQGVSPNPYRPMLMFDNLGATLTTASVWQSDEESIQNGLDARDITGDGYPDLAVAKWVNFQSGVYFNTSGTLDIFQSLFTGNTDGDRGAAFADLGDDSIPEIAFGEDPTGVYQYVHGAILGFYQTDPPFSGPQEIYFVDVDDDGDEDLAEIHFSDGRAHIYMNNDGVLDVQPTWTFDASEVGNAMAFGDLNNDGRTDMALGYAGNTCIRVFFGQTSGCDADLNADGLTDIFDVLAFIEAFNEEHPSADFSDDGVFDIFDVIAFVDVFNMGCP